MVIILFFGYETNQISSATNIVRLHLVDKFDATQRGYLSISHMMWKYVNKSYVEPNTWFVIFTPL